MPPLKSRTVKIESRIYDRFELIFFSKKITYFHPTFYVFFRIGFIVPEPPSLVDIAACVSAELLIKSVFEWFLEASRAPWFQERPISECSYEHFPKNE